MRYHCGCEQILNQKNWRTNEEWYAIDYEKDCFVLTEKATERAKKSFELYKEMQKKYR